VADDDQLHATLTAVAKATGVAYSDLLDPADRRPRRLARARQLAMYVVGRVFARHHTTVMHGCRVVARDLNDGDPTTTQRLDAIRAELEA